MKKLGLHYYTPKIFLWFGLTSLFFPPMSLEAALPPTSSSSYYMDTIDTVTLYEMGYQKGRADFSKAGTQQSIVILDFGGQPSPTTVSLRGMPDATLDQVKNAVQAYSRGYWKGTGSDNYSTVQVIVGTNNSYTVTNEGGRNFANMIDAINAHNTANSYSDQVEVDGGNDMEPGYDDTVSTRDWVKGYDAVNSYSLYNYGSADGCYHTNTNTGTTNYSCNNGWTYNDIYYISWGASPSWPLPQVYDNSGDMAEQWQNINKYSAISQNNQMKFGASLTQAGACQDVGCHWELDNTPSQGWTQLINELNSDAITAESTKFPILSTDIQWH